LGRKLERVWDKLIGEYPLLTDQQKEYVSLCVDPKSKINGLRQSDIAEMIGVSLRTLMNWRKKAEVRDAIVKETNRRSSDRYADVLDVIETIVFDKNAENRDKLKAIDLWGKFHGVTEEAKNKIADKKSKEGGTYEDKLTEIKDRLGDDIEDDLNDEYGETDEES
jgi:transcriptional regulator with XRE-family HTH domain